MKKVAVIGAGAAGLIALRHLIAHPSKFSPIAFEQTDAVGGTWVYTDRTEKDEEGFPLHTSMYKNLKTNLPRQLMEIPCFPFDNGGSESHVMHQDVIKYLNDFTDRFDLRKFIQFRTSVEKVKPIHSGSGLHWEVTTRKRPAAENDSEKRMFDAVIVCNGHYSEPIVPPLSGLESFTGEVLHSHNYRDPEIYRDQRVFILGAGISGQDICVDLAPYAKHVYLSSNKPPLLFNFPSNISQKSGIKRITGKTVITEADEEIQVDLLLLCTGYKFTFPFLTSECGITVEDERVYPAYKHIIQPSLPSLSFIGLCKASIPFPMFDIQVKFVLAALDGSMKLPTVEEMLQDIEKDYQKRLSLGMPSRYAHHLAHGMGQYDDMIADLAGVERVPPVLHKIFYRIIDHITQGVIDFKSYNYEVLDAENFREHC